jgi:hypothetical protein
MPAGRLLTYDDDESVYGYGRVGLRALSGGHARTEATGYILFAEALTPEAASGTQTSSWLLDIFAKHRSDLMDDPDVERSGIEELAYDALRETFRERQRKWDTELPFVARALVLSRDAVLVAGGHSLTESAERHGPGTIWSVSREDGSRRTTGSLPAPPVLDGMALTDAGVFVSALEGSLISLGATK